jgi:hypothetical protein
MSQAVQQYYLMLDIHVIYPGPRAVLDAVVKKKIPSPGRESNPKTPIVQPVG